MEDVASNPIETESDVVRRAVSRRALVGVLGASVVAGAVGAEGSASAATGTMMYGALNDSGEGGTSLQSGAPDVETLTLHLDNVGLGKALWVTSADLQEWAAEFVGRYHGVAVRSPHESLLVLVEGEGETNFGVRAQAYGGTAVDAQSVQGVGIRASSSSGRPLIISPNSGPETQFNPTSGASEMGTFYLESTTGQLFVCVAGGNPPTWRSIAAPKSGGRFLPDQPRASVRLTERFQDLDRAVSGCSRWLRSRREWGRPPTCCAYRGDGGDLQHHCHSDGSVRLPVRLRRQPHNEDFDDQLECLGSNGRECFCVTNRRRPPAEDRLRWRRKYSFHHRHHWLLLVGASLQSKEVAEDVASKLRTTEAQICRSAPLTSGPGLFESLV